MMTGLPDGWESDYDGTRWFYRYKATGMIQYHFPQPGDEFAEYLLDAGTGPFQLTPEDSLAIEQQSKRRSLSSVENDAKSGTKTGGSRRERKTIGAIEEEDGMSATGYFDPSSFMYFPDDPSPLGDDDGEASVSGNGLNGDRRNATSGMVPGPSKRESIINNTNAQPVAAELPESGQQMWSPVGYVAELATQDTVKCAEELAPVELDATSITPAPIQTNMAQVLAELPTHRTPVEAKGPDPRPTQPATQPADSYPLVSASFAYPPLKANTIPVSSGATSMTNAPTSSSTDSVDLGQNKYQPWKPTQGVSEQQPQAHSKASEILSQTSVLQNQNTELGSVGRKNSENAESSMSASIPDALTPPSRLSKPPSTESSNPNLENSFIPAVLQPAHNPMNESVPPQTTDQQSAPETQANHNSTSVSVTGHNLSHAPSVLKPGGRLPNNSFQENDGNLAHQPQHCSHQYVQASAVSHHPSGQGAPSGHGAKPSITRIESLPVRLPSANLSPPKMNGSPGFLFFHEIPNTSRPTNHGTTIHTEETTRPTIVPRPSDPSSVSGIAIDQIPAVAPLNFVKLHSSKSSEVSSITVESQDPNSHATLVSSDEISEVISVINSFTPHGTPVPSSQPSQPLAHTATGNGNKPSPTAISGGAGGRYDMAATVRPQTMSSQTLPPGMNTQQFSTHSQVPQQVSPALATASVTTATVSQATVVSPANNAGVASTQSRPNTQTPQHPIPIAQGSVYQNQNPSQFGNPNRPSGPLRPQGHVPNSLPQSSAAIPSARPTSQASNTTHANQLHQPAMPNNYSQYTNNPVSHPQATMPASNGMKPPQAHVTSPAQQAVSQPYGQSAASPQSAARPPTVGNHQTTTQKPNLQQPATTRPPMQQPAVQPSPQHQVLSQAATHASAQPPHQQPSPATQPVSPLQSQVSSPAQSVASLYISQSSTPSNTFATMNTPTSPNNGSNINANPIATASTRPPSIPPSTTHYYSAQQVGNFKPPNSSYSLSPLSAGTVQPQSPPTANPAMQSYPMLPGQVTLLPSQAGSAPVPSTVHQLTPNNHALPPANTQQTAAGQQLSQPVSGGLAQHHGMSFQANPSPNSAQGSVTYGQGSSQAQIKPPQQQIPPSHPGANHAGGHQHSANPAQTPQTVSYTPPPTSGQHYNPQMALPPQGVSISGGGQYTFPLPPQTQAQQLVQSPGVTSPATATQGSTFTSAQAATAITDAGKGMKKWAKKMLGSPTIKQTAVGIVGDVVAESMGVSGAAGAQLATSLYASTTRPSLNQAQTAPPQASGVHGAAPQRPPVPMSYQQQPGKPLPLHPQPNHHPGHPQPGQPHPGQPHPGQQQSGFSQPGHPQPGQPQSGYPQPSQPPSTRPQPVQSQPGHPQLVGAQTPGRPPFAQNPTLVAGVAVNFSAQAQGQVGFNQQQQYPLARPMTVGNLPPPPPLPPPPGTINAQAQVNIDANVAAAATGVINSAIGAALRPDYSQPQHPQNNSHGYAAENHAGAHEQTYGSSVPPPPATYPENNYTVADTTYIDNSNYSVNNTYTDNTDVVNNTIYVENSTAVYADMTYSNANYTDTTSYSGGDVTTNPMFYTDGNAAAFSGEQSVEITSSSDFAVASEDYSGGGWGDFDF
ncbi:hypothetical protein F5B17DRAFT_96641 [Nemania serpens]|nr:hypothetical protein F5B17DRAFT_96641 [Nemania serpens]